MEMSAYQNEPFKSIIYFVNFLIQKGAFLTLAPN